MAESGDKATPDSAAAGERPLRPAPPPLPEGAVSWAVLLARWIDFARAAVAFPRDRSGVRWRSSVAPAIGLQAVAFALGELDHVAPEERPAALDRAEVLIRRHAAELHEAWRGQPMHPELGALVDDALRSLAAARSAGTEWIVVDERIVAPDLSAVCSRLAQAGGGASALVAPPGTILFRGSPLAYFRPAPAEAPPPGAEARSAGAARQVYRQVDEATGRVVRDLVVPLASTLPAGRPLLTPVLEGGRIVSTLDSAGAERWRLAQLDAMGTGPTPVVFDAEAD